MAGPLISNLQQAEGVLFGQEARTALACLSEGPEPWKRLFEDSPLSDVTPHVLRHSFASIANDLGFTEVTIAALVGHAKGSASIRLTQRSSWLRTRSRATFKGSSTESNSSKLPTRWTATHEKLPWHAS